jgi:hypothetical protein
MRKLLVSTAFLLATLDPAFAQVGDPIGPPNGAIGIDVPEYPQLIRVPGLPVHYDPSSSSNYFFFDGMFWVYQDDGWYAASWYDGPWMLVGPASVPVELLRVPIRYYRQRPAFFRDGSAAAPPRWGEHWGARWERMRAGWATWERTSEPRIAPLPLYQKDYEGPAYPAPELQAAIRERNYPYVPEDPAVRDAHEARAALAAGRVPRSASLP